ncbi:type I phosphatidylinositol 4,5-bisphosphate 4-phosphatase-B-like [Varroa jacobsoni]|uniref:Phosphatidylinositol-4,5-bisphosphate 4-phosphatase n=1 Tax=Varroa destructor TaxID=109461 RepID=A0A7M7J7A0_VARDE|nr:type I phosphatidylinositol 4,5-bisphosphate 4-phosphatase-B-like isoform X2 [Varroa destructor]XP_022709431.1 type I phosphatidylinositol 4,5-bisphosphate 4-phosphatase-B-like [Varroa jacobsoni]XP_022709432.1 type I phosphatidylinositol 4,5-bisphosphate 4-phosphatase-B-like [Varroa jacobsoni]XP_022709433.1 type I phosphatidylinositol 4,5-bisphosphate 4-phosphatase-B-like [Varroa jacobsoni]
MPQEERQPLLGPNNQSTSGPTSKNTSYISEQTRNGGDRAGPSASNRRYEENIAQVELPPALMPQSPPYGSKIPCKVCGETIDLTDRMDSPVVKCAKCNESTPIRSAPPGKKYIRCTCRCLLICKATAQRVSCPRSDCGRVLYLAPLPNSFPGYSLPGLCSVSCGYCGQAFMFNTFSNALARCPSCRKVTSVGAEFARSRGLVFFILSLLSAVVGIALTAATYKVAGGQKAWLVAYIICFLLFVVLFLRAIYYCTLKVSHVNVPGGSNSTVASLQPDTLGHVNA